GKFCRGWASSPRRSPRICSRVGIVSTRSGCPQCSPIPEGAAPSSADASRGVPALAIETPAGLNTPQAQEQVAIATPPQTPPPQTTPQIAPATTPRGFEGKVITAPPPKPEIAPAAAEPAQQTASLPAPNSSP